MVSFLHYAVRIAIRPKHWLEKRGGAAALFYRVRKRGGAAALFYRMIILSMRRKQLLTRVNPYNGRHTRKLDLSSTVQAGLRL